MIVTYVLSSFNHYLFSQLSMTWSLDVSDDLNNSNVSEPFDDQEQTKYRSLWCTGHPIGFLLIFIFIWANGFFSLLLQSVLKSHS